jgi:hypothetical protein
MESAPFLVFRSSKVAPTRIYRIKPNADYETMYFDFVSTLTIQFTATLYTTSNPVMDKQVTEKFFVAIHATKNRAERKFT